MVPIGSSQALDPHSGANWDYRIKPTTLSGANGIRFDPDGQLYVAQFLSSQVNVIDVEKNVHSVLPGEGFAAPDDLAFDDRGVLFATEVMDGRVSARKPNGDVEVIARNLPGANGIAIHQNRIFVDEFRPGGRLLELPLDGKAPRVIAQDLPLPNALCVGADGFLYYPAVAAGEIWRVHPDRGQPELFFAGLSMPTSVKSDSRGNLVVTEAASGKVTRIDISTHRSSLIAQLRPGLDNCDHDAKGRLYVSHFVDGGVSEILNSGDERPVISPGLLGPWGLDCDDQGTLFVADGMSLISVDSRQISLRVATFSSVGFPGFVRNVIALSDGAFILSTSAGIIARYHPTEEVKVLASGLDQITGLALADDDSVMVAEAGTGRLLRVRDTNITAVASGLGQPMGIAKEPNGCFAVADSQSGQIFRVERGDVRSIVKGLQAPHGLALHQDNYIVVDRDSRKVLQISRDGRTIKTLATNLPIGSAHPKANRVLPGTEVLAGPLIAFNGIAVCADGTAFISCDAEGSVIALRLNRSD